MVGNLWRQNIYLDSATLEKSPSFSCVLLVARLGGAGSQSQRAAAVLILGLASKHSHSSGLPCQHSGAHILSYVMVLWFF